MSDQPKELIEKHIKNHSKGCDFSNVSHVTTQYDGTTA